MRPRQAGGVGASPQGVGWRPIFRLLPYLWPADDWTLRARVVLAGLCLIVAKLASVSAPYGFKLAVDALTPAAGAGAAAAVVAPIGLIAAYAALRVAGQAFGELRDALFARVGQRAVRAMGMETFRHIHALSLRFHLERRTGGLSRVIERGSKGAEFLLHFVTFNILPTLLEILLVSGVLLKLYGAAFALAAAGTILVYILFTVLVTEWRTRFRREMNERDTEAASKAVDSLLNYETVKYFNAEAHETARFDTALSAYEHAAVKSQTSLNALNVGQGAIIAVGLAVIMGLAAQGVAAGSMSVGDFVLVNAYLIQLYLPLNFLGFVYRQIRQSLADMEEMFTLLNVEREIADAPNAPELDLADGAIHFENVHFAYDARRPILQGVDFTIPAGKTVAVVGASGAGKSTLSRLLYRFYDVQQGRIAIDGQDVRAVTQDSLRRAIGIVPQDTVLFNDTVYYNIAYGRPDATPAEVEAAARLARIHDFVTHLPDGYRTRVGERGLKLSGGEKQRVAIARVILKKPRLLIFDEATSALDTRTEREIQASLDQVSENRTTLIIAHRLSTVINADEIIVLDAGQVVERGRHQDLLARGGRYAEMWARQQDSGDGDAPAEPA